LVRHEHRSSSIDHEARNVTNSVIGNPWCERSWASQFVSSTQNVNLSHWQAWERLCWEA